jgi:hypothetical protein
VGLAPTQKFLVFSINLDPWSDDTLTDPKLN